MSFRLTSIVAASAAILATSFAFAAAPPPARPVPSQLYSGLWYEVARTPNARQRDCQAATSEFNGLSGANFRVTQTCRRGSPTGPAQTFRASGRILPQTNNAKIRLSFFGGVVSQEYWILDRADDHSWAIMATPGGNYVWLLSRRPVLDPATRARLVARLGQLGYPAARVEFPAQAG